LDTIEKYCGKVYVTKKESNGTLKKIMSWKGGSKCLHVIYVDDYENEVKDEEFSLMKVELLLLNLRRFTK